MKRMIALPILLLAFAICFSACNISVTPPTTDQLVQKWDPNMFRKMRNVNPTEIDPFVELLATVIEQEDAESLRLLFAPNLLESALSDTDVEELFAFFEGTVTAAKHLACYDSEQKEGSRHSAETMIACTIETTVRTYHIAVKLCIVDSEDMNNVGICSLYIVDAENWDTQFAYWGGHEWHPGIIIDTNPKLFSTETTTESDT